MCIPKLRSPCLAKHKSTFREGLMCSGVCIFLAGQVRVDSCSWDHLWLLVSASLDSFSLSSFAICVCCPRSALRDGTQGLVLNSIKTKLSCKTFVYAADCPGCSGQGDLHCGNANNFIWVCLFVCLSLTVFFEAILMSRDFSLARPLDITNKAHVPQKSGL